MNLKDCFYSFGQLFLFYLNKTKIFSLLFAPFCIFIFHETGGLFGSVTVTVRTVGGGEPWTSHIDPRTSSQTDDTIADVLGKRDSATSAEFGKDYNVLNEVVHFAVHIENS